MIKLSERNIAILATIFALSFIVILFFLKSESQGPPLVSCTLEAKICPDGSAVGRGGPKCEFSPCPEASPTPAPTSEWKTYTSDQFGFSFDYPSRFQPAPPQGENGPYYYTLSNLGSKYGENITVGAISNNPEYKTVSPEIVAKKEMATSGYKYTVTKLKVNSYSAGITTFEGTDVSTNTLTIAYPKNNLFIYLILPRDLSKVDFEKILSTFKFIEKSNTCINDHFKLSINLPNDNWKCDSQGDWINLTSPTFSISISDAGRGPYCGDGDDPYPNNKCVVTKFYSNKTIGLSTFTNNGVDGEIFGTFTNSGPNSILWMSIKYQDMSQKKLTATQKAELIKLIDSIKYPTIEL